MTAVRPAARTAPAARARPAGTARAGTGDARPRLRVLSDEQLAARARRRRVRVALVLSSLLAVAGLFGIAVFHVLITQSQFRLEQLEARATQEQARYERLRLRVAELESPARVVAAAQERLGMVPPPGVRYLSPAGAAADVAAERNDAGAQPDAAEPGASVAATGGWTTVKPHLAPRP